MSLRAVLVFAAFALLSRAQSSNGYVFVAPGSVSPGGGGTVHLGAGGEAVLGRTIGVGAEIGYLTSSQSFDAGLGIFSPNLYVHILPLVRPRIDPYVTGGYSLIFRSGHINAGNFGVGTNLWLWSRFGVKVEFRDHVSTSFGDTTHFWGFRFGAAFR